MPIYAQSAPLYNVAIRAGICKRLRSPGIDSARLGIVSLAPSKVYKYGLWMRTGCC
jgi:hypothetical protein